jgi:AraC-like DNA-binding protein
MRIIAVQAIRRPKMRKRRVVSSDGPAGARHPGASAPGAGSDRPGLRTAARCADHGQARSHVGRAFSRQFRAAYGETPYSYLMTRRVERAMALLRGGMSVTDACMTVGCTSLGSFSSRFTELVGEPPSAYSSREHRAVIAMPACVAKVRTRPIRNPPSRNGEAARETAA